MVRGDASKTADLLAQSGLIQSNQVTAAAKLLEAIDKLKNVSFSSSQNSNNLISELSRISSGVRAVLQTEEISKILEDVSGLAVIMAYQDRILEMNHAIAHLNELTMQTTDLTLQACGALDKAANLKQSLISKIQSLQQEIEGNKASKKPC